MRRVTLCRDARSERPLYHSKTTPIVTLGLSVRHPSRNAYKSLCISILSWLVVSFAGKKFAKHLVDWESCSTFALATQKNGVLEVSEPHERRVGF